MKYSYTIILVQVKNLLLLVSFILISTYGIAQISLPKKGEIFLSPGIGIATVWDEFGTKLKVPPISVTVAFTVSDKITIGPYLGYGATSGNGWGYFIHKQTGDIVGPEYYTYTFSHFLLGVKGAYHFPIADKLYGYGGGIIGYHSAKIKYTSSSLGDGYEIDDDRGSQLLYDIFIGGRYAFSDNASVFAELGYGITYLNLGVLLKLK